MSKKNAFVNYVEENLFSKIDVNNIDPDVLSYWKALKEIPEVEKPLFTDNGKLIMKYLQDLPEGTPMLKAKDIAEGMFISARTVSGSMRKLVSDGFVEKVGQDPILYLLTDAGKAIKIED
jgi:DNA-binding MarR family transcriptional regulator